MSEDTVDVVVRAREDAISTLKAVQAEIANTGRISEQTRQIYMKTRQEVVDQTRSLNTLRMAYREQYQTLELTGRAFQSLSTVVGQGLRMYEQYNVAMIRQNQLQDAVTKAQDKYNQAVSQFGPASAQAIAALNELTDAQERLQQAQQQNLMMFAGFALQVPAFIRNLNDMQVSFRTLVSGIQASAGAMAALQTASMAGVVGLAAMAGAIAVAGIALQAQYVPAVWQATQRMNELKTAFASHAVITVDLTKQAQAYQEAIGATNAALQEQVARVLANAMAQREASDAVTKLVEQYSEGAISAEVFAKAMLKQGVAAEDVEKMLSTTTVHVATWQEQLVAQAQEAASGFADAFTGPMAQIGPAMSQALTNMVNVTNALIQAGLIGQAQSNMQAFRDCLSKKIYDIPGLQQAAMNDLVSLTNTAINEGLRGEAQQNIALFVQCAQSKQLSMVQEIDGYLKQLQQSYADNNAQILTLTSQGKDQEAQLYRDSNANIQSTIAQLLDWRDAIITGRPVPNPFAGLEQQSTDAQTNIKTVGTTLDALPATKDITVNILNADALTNLAAVSNALAAIQDKNVTVTVNYRTEGSLGLFGGFQHGGIVPITGPYLLHAGEYVIPNRAGEDRYQNRRFIEDEPSVDVRLAVPITTVVEVDGERVQKTMESRLIRSHQVGSRYR